MKLTMMILASFTSILFSMTKHPMAMGATLLAQTLIICMMSGQLMSTFWFSYILFIIFLGGLLVLFIYVTTLASNEMFNFSTITAMTTMMLTIITYTFWSTLNSNPLTSSYPETLPNTMILITEISKPLIKLYNYPTMLITILMAMYMLLTLIAVVKIITIKSGPLRSMS